MRVSNWFDAGFDEGPIVFAGDTDESQKRDYKSRNRNQAKPHSILSASKIFCYPRWAASSISVSCGDVADKRRRAYSVNPGGDDLRILLNWLLSALAVWLVSRVVPGFHVSGLAAALIAALVIGFVNATLGLLLKLITLPLTILTLGLFWFVINALMLEMAAAVVPGFRVDTFASAFWGAIVLSLVNMLFRWLAGTGRKEDQAV